jgi:hypothetical protein
MGDLAIATTRSVSGTGVLGSLAIGPNDPPQSSLEGWGAAMAAASSTRSAGDQSRLSNNKADDGNRVLEAGQRAQALLAQPVKGSPTACQQEAASMNETAGQFQRYLSALPGARSAQDMNSLGDRADAPMNQPGLKRLPLNAADLNKALGIDPSSPNAIEDRDLRNDTTGYRAALYQSESDGNIIMVSRDTEPHSLVDWKANIENGEGKDTKQYQAARNLAAKLHNAGKQFDVAGYSKGGGLAQEAGLVSPDSKVYVFNSAGLNSASLARTGNANFVGLASRTSAFSSEGDFLTFMNNTADQAGQLANARFLRDQLAGPSGWSLAAAAKPIQIQYESPANMNSKDPRYLSDRRDFLKDIDAMIASKEANPGGSPLFPPVRAGSFDTIPNSTTWMNRQLGANDPGPTLGKLAQHQISNVVAPMEHQIEVDRAAMKDFLKSCR